ncbi:MAG: UDP-N-acetylmuramoyl-L-alanine--D-glutamate ligase [Verrucomicrobiaceae bacterium]
MLELYGQTVAILGAGRSGLAAAKLACQCGGEVTVFDSRGAEVFASFPADIATCAKATPETASGKNFDLVVVSPGIETHGDFVQAFAQNSGALWGEIELGWRCFDGVTIGITGTNGKTTTTELVDLLVRATGKSCAPCGNYGVPLCEIVLRDEVPEVVALELSSFQLETIVDFKPDAVIWLNFSADHMDRYESLMEYFEAKQRIFKNIDNDTPVVIRQGETLLSLPGLKGEVTTFASEEEADWSLDGDNILKGGQPFIAMSGTKLRGLHNAENLMAACAVIDGLTAEVAEKALRDYAPPVHRCELVRILDDVEWINDSKATNLHALESALRSQVRPTVLLAGGKQKGLNYEPLKELLEAKVVQAVFYGEIGPALAVTFFDVVPTETVDTLDEAVKFAAQNATSGQTVLLSPGTSSFDQFSGYEERGDVFKASVLALH